MCGRCSSHSAKSARERGEVAAAPHGVWTARISTRRRGAPVESAAWPFATRLHRDARDWCCVPPPSMSRCGRTRSTRLMRIEMALTHHRQQPATRSASNRSMDVLQQQLIQSSFESTDRRQATSLTHPRGADTANRTSGCSSWDWNSVPFFVLGAQRSGTTMLRLMLNMHPDLLVPHESGFIKNFAERFADPGTRLDSVMR